MRDSRVRPPFYAAIPVFKPVLYANLDISSFCEKAHQKVKRIYSKLRTIIFSFKWTSILSMLPMLRNNHRYKNSLSNWKAVFLSMPGGPDIMGFLGFFYF